MHLVLFFTHISESITVWLLMVVLVGNLTKGKNVPAALAAVSGPSA